jgi:hypothetical protein
MRTALGVIGLFYQPKGRAGHALRVDEFLADRRLPLNCYILCL